MPTTLLADTGAGGHRHLHVRFLFEFICGSHREDLMSFWFYITSETADAVVATLSAPVAEAFRSRVIFAAPGGGRPAFLKVLKAARSVLASHIIFLEIDPFIYTLVTRPIPLPVSGVWFRPNYHYGKAGFTHEDLRQRALSVLKSLVVSALCSRKSIYKLFVFDPWAAKHAPFNSGRTKVQYVPDPTAFPLVPAARMIAWQTDRCVLGIVGSICRRKGVVAVLAAVRSLSRDVQRKVELRIVGRVSNADREALTVAIHQTRQETAVRVVQTDRFVSDEDIDKAIIESDVLLLLYRKFIGSSGILIRSALYGRPVLATQYGLLGALVSRQGLGLTVDPYDECAIARAIGEIVTTGRLDYDPERARRFAAKHSPHHYAKTLCAPIGGVLSQG